jgi:hypothetical protein
MSLKLKGSASNHEPTCYKLGTSLLGIDFYLADKTQLYAHYSFLSHLEMRGNEEIAVHYTFGVVRLVGRHLEPVYSLLKQHNLEFARRSDRDDPCREEIEVTKIVFEDAIANGDLAVDK